LRASVRRLRIENGTLQFADRSLANPFEVTLRELSGSITSLGNAAGEPARIRLAGRVQPYGSARIRGSVDLDAPTKLADVTASLQNLRLEAFNPYIAKFAGYRIESGRLSANLRYQLREGRLVGTNRLAFEQMRLGEKLEARGLLDVPLELVVALLADSQGRIDLEIPVRGNLNDPQFDLGAIVARAFGNVLHKIVSAPFRALAALFGGKDAINEETGNVAFQPGSSALSPPAEEGVARLAQALAGRPQLGVEVRGGYDPARDVEALRLRRAREELARAAGVRGPPDLADPKVVRAAEALYLKRIGDRAALKELRKSEERYGRALLQRLAAAVPADEGAAQALARERSEAVRVALIDHGVDPARVRTAEPVAGRASEQGVPAEISPVAARP
jgi:outer membrane protein OmpA-like peptidoglycan-associated protein